MTTMTKTAEWQENQPGWGFSAQLTHSHSAKLRSFCASR
ncbi:hypothetical protein ymoll0001_9460 [Yersinia mollaretii ATCC 43969]|uniref:Uncharacterized protein n=1 Tax=Yersinia mollaretii (strain ATCC 43969 / DSM 18520 / CIP 103324 / CNY 7263 / WAIP 204) TaxID=349967 RepID=A0ABP2EAM0_YERMW|nr:hypothetical protein ymoll0001_9460 [Yersinia mollaretii ATCC 43969]